MGTTDGGLDALSRRLLDEIEELRQLELEKRRAARSSDEFHELAGQVDDAARHVFDSARAEAFAGHDDSPLPEEREEQDPGDWSDGSADESGPDGLRDGSGNDRLR